MRILVLSDIHANLIALEAVLEAAGEVDATWCLGDVVGYGPQPNECVERIHAQANLTCLQGNHDAAAVGDLPLDSFNPEARASLEWLQETLNGDAAVFLKAGQRAVKWENFTLVHASPRQPVLEYLLDAHSAAENFDYFDTDYCFVGHTHIPVMFKLAPLTKRVTLRSLAPNSTYELKPRQIVNPGSVGQPRDRDPRAAFAILDTEKGKLRYRRVDYDVKKVQSMMEALHLPKRHIQRLESGW
jgi:predicted phosphodiesterase